MHITSQFLHEGHFQSDQLSYRSDCSKLLSSSFFSLQTLPLIALSNWLQQSCSSTYTVAKPFYLLFSPFLLPSALSPLPLPFLSLSSPLLSPLLFLPTPLPPSSPLPTPPSPLSLLHTHSLLGCSKLLLPTGDNGHAPVYTPSKPLLQ